MEHTRVFGNRRFGLFIHWGIYAVMGWHEQVLWRWQLQRTEYEQTLNAFRPDQYDPLDWVRFAKQIGADYLCFTVKHHDGFCMWNTAFTDYQIMHTPFGKDAFGLLAKACEKESFPLGIYYSCVDWHHRCYPNMGRSHELAEPRSDDTPNIEAYYAYVRNQLQELCTEYGSIYQLFWDLNIAEYKDPAINEQVKRWQPGVIINDRGPGPGDYRTREREWPKVEDNGLQLEACQSIGCSSWGYKSDEDYFSTKYLMQSIDRFLSEGANYLLNIGPDAHGLFPPEGRALLQRVGAWYHRVKESYEDTRNVCIDRTKGQIHTYKDRVLYVHLNEDNRSSKLVLDRIRECPVCVTLLNTGTPLEYMVDVLPYDVDKGPCLRIRNIPVDELANQVLVLKIEFEKPPAHLSRFTICSTDEKEPI